MRPNCWILGQPPQIGPGWMQRAANQHLSMAVDLPQLTLDRSLNSRLQLAIEVGKWSFGAIKLKTRSQLEERESALELETSAGRWMAEMIQGVFFKLPTLFFE